MEISSAVYKSDRKARFFVGLFALPFFCVGLFALYSIVSSFEAWVSMQGWQATPARVIDGGYKTHSGSDSGSTYEAYATYTYEYAGVSRKGTRVAIDEMADNVGSFHEDLGNTLSAARRSGQPVTVYVNPDDPNEAVVSRDLRWGMVGFKAIFLVAFGGIGGALLFGAIRGGGADLTAAQQQSGPPWMLQKDWQTNEIKSNSKFAMQFFWGFAILWNAISSYIPFALYTEVLQKQNYPALLGALFPLAGIFLLAKAVHRTLEWRRFGEAAVVMNPYPGSIGGQVGGTIELNRPFDPATKFILTLSCVLSTESGSGKNRSRREDMKWQDKIVAYTESGIYGTRILFAFDVPAGLPPSDAEKFGRSYHIWRLNLTADMPGVDLDRSYELPVYPSTAKSTHIGSRAAEQSRVETKAAAEEGMSAKIALRPSAFGEEMFYPAGRNVSAACVVMVFGAAFTGVGLFMTLHEAMWVFGGIFLLLGAPFALGGLYMPLNSLSVAADGLGHVVTVRRILGIPVKRRTVAVADIKAVSKHSSFGTTDARGEQVRHFTVYAELGGRDKVVLGEGFHGDREGDAALAFIRNKLGISEVPSP